MLTAFYAGLIGDLVEIVHLQNVSVSSGNQYPNAAAAEFRLNSSGVAEGRGGAAAGLPSFSSLFTWLVIGSAGDYECRMTVDAGTFLSGTVGSWQALSSTRTWTKGALAGETLSVTATLEIRNAATEEVLDTCSVVLFAISSSGEEP